MRLHVAIRSLTISALTFVILGWISQAHAWYEYRGEVRLGQGQPSVKLRDSDSGREYQLLAGQVTIHVDNYGTFGGAGGLRITQGGGTVEIKIPYSQFGSSWKFNALASNISQSVTITGSDSVRVEVGDEQPTPQNCSVQPQVIPVLNDANQQITIPIKDMSTNKTIMQPLYIRVCARATADGRVEVRQVSSFQSCSGSQQVLAQPHKQTEVYTVTFISPQTNQTMAEIVATAKVSESVKVTRELTPCL